MPGKSLFFRNYAVGREITVGKFFLRSQLYNLSGRGVMQLIAQILLQKSKLRLARAVAGVVLAVIAG
jgi:hypothetical protein